MSALIEPNKQEGGTQRAACTIVGFTSEWVGFTSEWGAGGGGGQRGGGAGAKRLTRTIAPML